MAGDCSFNVYFSQVKGEMPMRKNVIVSHEGARKDSVSTTTQPVLPKRFNKSKYSMAPRLGSFGMLLAQYPIIRGELILAFFTYDGGNNKMISNKLFFYLFIKLCHEVGITGSQYPFNTKYFGKRSLDKFLNNLRNAVNACRRQQQPGKGT
jgi:hypothetical protein